MNVESIDRKKRKLDALLPLPAEAVRNLREHILVQWTYHSNAIEGNTLTLSETKVVLEGITVGGKLLREHLEVINHAEAIEYVEDLVARNEPVITDFTVKQLHYLVLKNIRQPEAGTYRNINVFLQGSDHVRPMSSLVPGLMRDRLLSNLILMQNGFPPVIIRNEDRAEYYEALREADKSGSLDEIIGMFAKAAERMLDDYLYVLGVSDGR